MEENGHDQTTNEMIGLFDAHQEYHPGTQHGQCQVKQRLLSSSFAQFSINEKVQKWFFVNH